MFGLSVLFLPFLYVRPRFVYLMKPRENILKAQGFGTQNLGA